MRHREPQSGVATQGLPESLDCFVANTPRNDELCNALIRMRRGDLVVYSPMVFSTLCPW